MSISVKCHGCGKTLKAPDSAAGKRAKCPQCAATVEIPEPIYDAEAVDADESADGGADPFAGIDSYDSPADTSDEIRKPCPLCGEMIVAGAAKCRFCGEVFDAKLQRSGSKSGRSRSRDSTRTHRVITAGEVVSASWEIFSNNVGITLGGLIVLYILNIAVSLPQNILQAVAKQMQAQGDRDMGSIVSLIALCFVPVSLGGQIFLQVGLVQLTLNITQGNNPQIGDLFSGGKFFWRMLGSTMLFGLMLIVGALACIVPAIFVGLIFGVYAYALVDQDPPGIECLSVSRAVTKDNLGTLFLLGLIGFGINILGVLALCVGLFVTIPLTMLFYPVAYCKMTGQRIAA